MFIIEFIVLNFAITIEMSGRGNVVQHWKRHKMCYTHT